jgi:hypothetical protein
MGQLGELFPGAKLGRVTPDETGKGEKFEPGPLDLDGGVVRLRPRQAPAEPAEPVEDADTDGAED